MNVYISIGNSDDKLPQINWAEFQVALYDDVREVASAIHGVWYSDSTSEYQNSCICAEVPDDKMQLLRAVLRQLAGDYGQDSIALALADTEFVRPACGELGCEFDAGHESAHPHGQRIPASRGTDYGSTASVTECGSLGSPGSPAPTTGDSQSCMTCGGKTKDCGDGFLWCAACDLAVVICSCPKKGDSQRG